MTEVNPVRFPGMPGRVSVYEVGPRDGLQNEPRVVSVEDKAEFIRRLADAGIEAIELTSFVSEDRVPQLAGAEELLAGLGGLHGRHPVLVPNQRGLHRALSSGAVEIAVFASATESFARRNLNCTISESLARFAEVIRCAQAEGLAIRGYVSMCFGDPWEGDVAITQAADVVMALVELGCSEVSLGDTIGVATPGHVRALLEELESRGISAELLAVHFHDTYGQALSNVFAALQCGVTTVDSSAGGLGGCPFAKSAAGNLATEDLVWQLHGLGIDTGISLEKLCQTSRWMARILGRPSQSRALSALTVD